MHSKIALFGVLVSSQAFGATSALAVLPQHIHFPKPELPAIFSRGAQNHFGGRVQTASWPQSNALFCELGGELVDTAHEGLIGLCAELGVELESFSTGNAPGLNPELYFLGGQLRTEKEVIEAFNPLAQVIAKDASTLLVDGALTSPTFDNTLGAEKLDSTSLEAYLQAQSGLVESWLLNLIRQAYAEEYGLECTRQSALNLVLLINPNASEEFQIYGSSDESKRIKGGGSVLAKALVAAISKNVRIFQGHHLVGLTDNTTSFSLSFQKQNSFSEIRADRLILALPFSVLRNVKGIFNLNMLEQKKWAIREHSYGANSKLMLGFQSRFWREQQVPSQQQQTASTPPSTGNLFTDLSPEEFWETSRLPPVVFLNSRVWNS